MDEKGKAARYELERAILEQIHRHKHDAINPQFIATLIASYAFKYPEMSATTEQFIQLCLDAGYKRAINQQERSHNAEG